MVLLLCRLLLWWLLLLCLALISRDLGQADAMAKLKAQFAARREAIVAQASLRKSDVPFT